MALLLFSLCGYSVLRPGNTGYATVVDTRVSAARAEWLAEVFWQQAALDDTLRWNAIHPGIQAATLTCSPGGLMFCTLCREPGHAASWRICSSQRGSQRGSPPQQQPSTLIRDPINLHGGSRLRKRSATPGMQGGASTQVHAAFATGIHVAASSTWPGIAQPIAIVDLGEMYMAAHLGHPQQPDRPSSAKSTGISRDYYCSQ